MEDYIFILIAIVLSVFGAINQNKKKKMQQMMEDEQEPERESAFFDQIFDDPMFREEPKPQPVPKPVVVEKPRTVHERRIPEPKLQRQPLRSSILRKTEIGDAIKKDKIASSATKKEVETEGARYSIMSDFSLRKAILYAEILERKY
jgi:hypothetical protein